MSSDCALLLPSANAKECIDFYFSAEKVRPFNLVGHAVRFPWLPAARLLELVSLLLIRISEKSSNIEGRGGIEDQKCGCGRSCLISFWNGVIMRAAQIPWHRRSLWAPGCVPFDPVWFLHDTKRRRPLSGGDFRSWWRYVGRLLRPEGDFFLSWLNGISAESDANASFFH